MGTLRAWRARVRPLLEDLADARAWIVSAAAGVLVGAAVAALHWTAVSPGIAGGGATLGVRAYEWIRSGPTRRRAIKTTGEAAVAVLDAYIHSQNGLILSTGEVLTLRGLADAARAGRFRAEVAIGGGCDLRQQLPRLVSIFKDRAALGLPELASLRARGRELVDALEEGSAIGAELCVTFNRLVGIDRHSDEAHSLRAGAQPVLDRLSAAVDRAARAAEKLERRWDPAGAHDRRNARAAALAQIRMDRRGARRAGLEAARGLWTDADAERRMTSDSWAARATRLEQARERFTGVANVEDKRMDPATLEHVRNVQRHIWDAISAASAGAQAQLPLATPPDQRPDGTEQLAAIKSVEASNNLTAAVDAIAQDVEALAKLEPEPESK